MATQLKITTSDPNTKPNISNQYTTQPKIYTTNNTFATILNKLDRFYEKDKILTKTDVNKSNNIQGQVCIHPKGQVLACPKDMFTCLMQVDKHVEPGNIRTCCHRNQALSMRIVLSQVLYTMINNTW